MSSKYETHAPPSTGQPRYLPRPVATLELEPIELDEILLGRLRVDVLAAVAGRRGAALHLAAEVAT
jgi:hypothetical protein